MRVLLVAAFYAPAWSGGGIARASKGLADGLASLGHEVEVSTIRWDAGDAPEETNGRVRVRRYGSPGWLRERLFPWPLGAREALAHDSARCDVAHFAGFRTGLAWAAWRAVRRCRIPYVVQPHGTYPHHGARRLAKRVVDRFFGDRLVQEAAALVAVSHAEAADLPREARLVPNGVESVGVAVRTSPARGRDILFVGSDAPQKRAHVLVTVLQALPGTRLTLVGRCGEALRRRFRPFGERVTFRGVLAGDSLAAAYAGADLVVQPAIGEAFGLVPFEASFHGTAAVVAAGHGSGEWYRQAGGCVVSPDDIDALIAATRERLAEPERAAREAEAVAGFARRELTWPKVAREVEALYHDIRGRDSGRGRS